MTGSLMQSRSPKKTMWSNLIGHEEIQPDWSPTPSTKYKTMQKKFTDFLNNCRRWSTLKIAGLLPGLTSVKSLEVL